MPDPRAGGVAVRVCTCGRGIEFDIGHAAFCSVPSIAERDGLALDEAVTVNGQAATVIGFSGRECDVAVRYPSGQEATVCRRHAAVVPREDESSIVRGRETVVVGPVVDGD